MSQLQILGTTLAEVQAGTSITVGYPLGTQVGDLLIAAISYPGSPSDQSSGGPRQVSYGGGYTKGYSTPATGSAVSGTDNYQTEYSDRYASSNTPTIAGAGGGYRGGYGIGYAAPVASSGWNLLGTTTNPATTLGVYYRIATAADTTGSATFATALTVDRASAVMLRIDGAALPNFLDSTAVSGTSAGGSPFVTSVNIATPGTSLISFYSAAVADPAVTAAPPAEQTLLLESGGTGTQLAVATETRASVGPTGARSWRSIHSSGIDLTYPASVFQIAVAPSAVLASRAGRWNSRRPLTVTRSSSWKLGGPLAAYRSGAWAVSTGGAAGLVATRGTTWLQLRPVTTIKSTGWQTLASISNVTTFGPMLMLRVYDPIGADLGPAPTPNNTNVAYVLNDLGSLSFDYLVAAPRAAELFGRPCEVAVEFSPDGGVSWTEPYDSRFIYTADGRDPLKPDDAFAVSCKPYIWRLSKASLWDAGLNAEGKRPFLSRNPGQILKTLLAEAQMRGALKGIDHSSFSASVDSAGVPWKQVLTIYYEPGIQYLQILQNLADQGFIDYRMRGRSLYIYNADSAMAQDKTRGSVPVVLREGRDLVEAPFRRTWEGMADSALFVGDQGARYTYTNPAAQTPWGRQEVVFSNGSVSDPGTMAAITQGELRQTDAPRTEYTHGLSFVRAVSLPFRDYGPGDFVYSTLRGDTPEDVTDLTKLRVRQVTLSLSNRNLVSGNVVLNDRFLEADIRQKRRVEGITNGASGAAAPLPTKPVTDGTDKMAPAKVTNLYGSSDAYVGAGGFTVGSVTLGWTPVTTNADGTFTDDVDHYEVWAQTTSGVSGFVGEYGYEGDVYSNPVYLTRGGPGYRAGSNWRFMVRAVDRANNRGEFSNPLSLAIAQDVTPPQAPTTPTVTSRLGVIHVSWDGKPATGFWPLDFHHVDVHASVVNDFTPSAATLVDRLYGKGATVLADRAFGIPIFVKLIAVDTSDLQSLPSGQGSATPSRLVGSDLDPNAITYEQIAFKNPENIVIDGSFEDDVQTQTVLGRSHPSWSPTTDRPFHGLRCLTVDATTQPDPLRQLYLMSADDSQDILPGSKLFARMAYRGTPGANGTIRIVVDWLNATGARVAASTLPGTSYNGTWQQIAGQLAAPAGTARFRIYAQLLDATLGQFWIDAVEVRRTVGTSIIEDAAIGNAQIANLAVNSAQIMSLDVGKVTAGTLTATVLLGGLIRTATSGNRVELSATGMRLYRGSTTTAWMNPATGQLRIYNDTDASHTSRGHGLQFGDDDGQNLIIDNNEVMSRFNGDYGQLLLNREGGAILIGGIKGGFGTSLDRVYPTNDNHSISLRGHVLISNTTDAHYADDFPPLMIGRPGGQHLALDSNEILSSTGVGVGTLYLQGARQIPSAEGNLHHTSPIVLSSNSLGIARYGSYEAGTRSTFLYGWDGGCDLGIRFSGNQDRIYITSRDAQTAKIISASDHVVTSSLAAKHSVEAITGALAKVRKAKSHRWKYNDDVEVADRWHVGPMHEDLPPEVLAGHGDDAGDTAVERYGSVSLGSMIGLLWEAVRELDEKVDTKVERQKGST